jgi:hypothetical protein
VSNADAKMAMFEMTRAAGLLAALSLVTAAPAHAAFRPNLEVGLAPTAVKTSPLLTATVTRAATDTPIERFTLTLPAGFTRAGAPGAVPCDPASLQTSSCPYDTLIGSFTGQLGTNVPLGGAISKTGPGTFGLNVSVLGGAISQVVEGTVTRRSNGDLDIKLDQLPALPITNLALRFWGGAYSLIRNPARCGTYTIDGKFTSRRDELAIDRTQLQVGGCAGAPAVQVENIRFSDRSFKPGGSAYSARTIIAWWLSQAVDHTNIRIDRRVDGRWRELGKLVGSGNAGDNSVHWAGRLKGRRLEPGRYAVRIQPAGSEPSDRARFRIVD